MGVAAQVATGYPQPVGRGTPKTKNSPSGAHLSPWPSEGRLYLCFINI